MNSKRQYILNGNFIVSQFKGEVKVQGGLLDYTGSDEVIEKINSTKGVKEDIYLLVSQKTALQFTIYHIIHLSFYLGTGSCERVANYLMKGSGFHRILWFPPSFTTGLSWFRLNMPEQVIIFAIPK